MEGLKFENPIESEESREVQLSPLAQGEAQMLVDKFGEERGFFTRMPEKVRKFAKVMLLGTALSGGFGVEFSPAEAEAGDRQEYTITAQEIARDAYAQERERIAQRQTQKDVRNIQEIARNQARADAEWERNPNDVMGAAYAKEQARIVAREGQRRNRELERMGKEAAQQQAVLARSLFTRVIVGVFNTPNRIATPLIDRAFDGE